MDSQSIDKAIDQSLIIQPPNDHSRLKGFVPKLILFFVQTIDHANDTDNELYQLVTAKNT